MSEITLCAENCINEHIRVTYRNTKKTTYEQYHTVLLRTTSLLRKADYPTLPQEIDREAVNYLLNVVWKNNTVSYRKWLIHVLRRYLIYYKNETIADMEIKFSQDMRPNVDWLSDEQSAQLLSFPKTSLEDIVILLELGMGLRSVELCRLRVQDIHLNHTKPYIEVRGKGQGEGKYRSVPIPFDSIPIFENWYLKRNKMITSVKETNPIFIPPDNFLIWCRYEKTPIIGAYSERGHSLDRSVINKLRNRLGFKFSHHTLRRTFGRMCYHAEIPVATISKLYGHEDIATTLKYIGVDMDDMSLAIDILGQYQRKILGRNQ